MWLKMLEEDYAFAMWDWRRLNPMTSGCFTWIADFDQSVGVKRINTEWTHLQVKKKKTLLKILFSFVIFFMTVVCFKILVQPTSFPAFTLLGQQVLTGTQIACKSHLIWVQSGSGKLY